MHADGTGSDILYAVAMSDFMPQGLAATREHASRAVEMHHMTGLTLHDPAFNMLPTWPTGDEDSKSFLVLFFKKGLLSSFFGNSLPQRRTPNMFEYESVQMGVAALGVRDTHLWSSFSLPDRLASRDRTIHSEESACAETSPAFAT